MKIRLRATCAALVALAVLLSSVVPIGLAAQATSADSPAFDRLLGDNFAAVVIENASGRTEVQTWNSNRVRVTATRRQAAGTGGGALDSRINLGRAAPDALKITVRAAQSSAPIDLSIYVPRHVNLTVRGGAEDVVIKGVTGAMSVETDAGAISLHLPAAASTDLSLRSIEGSITSKLPLVVFGPVNTHALDGRTGQGGAPVILRSTRGAIDLVPDDPARLAVAGARSADELTPGAANVVRLVQTAGADRTSDAASQGPAAESEHGAAETNSPAPAASDVELRPGEELVRVNVRTVNLNAKVTDAAGKLIPDLTKDDFLIFEDNVAQEVVHFEPITAPVNLVLLLDLSGSTKDRMKIMKKAAKKFIESLNPNTRIAVAAFTRKFMLISDFTADRKLLKDRIDDVKNFNSGTAFYDSMWATLDLFKEVQERRKAVVVLTDGVDNSISSEQYEARHPFDELLARVAQEDATIYPIYFDTEYEVTVKHRQGQDSHESYVTARKQLQRIADDTGGTLFKAERAEDLEGVYQRVASELHTFYSVAYNPKDTNYDGRWRNVSIQIKGREAAVRTKRGFYAR